MSDNETRGFGPLPCPCCGERETSVMVDLAEMTDVDSCCCQSCNATFGLEDVEQFIRQWTRVLAWIRQAPLVEKSP